MNAPKAPTESRILIIDDNPAIHEDIRKILTRREDSGSLAEAKSLLFGEEPATSEQAIFEIDSAFQGQEGLQKVKEAEEAARPYALAFVDVRMPPGWDGVETISRIWQQYPHMQIVVCTAYSDYSWEDMIRRFGKSDSLVILKKPFDTIELLQLAHALTEKWRLSNEVRRRLKDLDGLVRERTIELQSANEQLKSEVAERVRMGNALRVSEERFSKAFKASPIPLAIQSLGEEKYVDANQGFEQLTGFSRDEVIGRTPQELGLWNDAAQWTAIQRSLQEHKAVRNLPCQWLNKARQLRQVVLSAELFDTASEPFLLTITEDITEQLALEHQLRQSQKMDAVGQLAAGVAHDFNNRLAVILGHASMLFSDKPVDSPDCRSLKAILEASERAGKLVRQLLTFSRKQVIQMRPLAIQEILTPLGEMLPRLLGENIIVKVNAPAEVWINADSGMLDQLLMNLSVNARDAMPQGGQLNISAREIELEPAAAREIQDARPGRFLRLSVADTGCGIAPDVLPRIFEPFFTTKPVGKGTGLGLASVYGIAKQHGGWVQVISQPGHGASFNVFIPTCAAAIPVAPAETARPAPKGGHETILVAEDDDDVREFVVEVLSSSGYKVIHANSGKQALEAWAGTRDKIHLLLTDMVMPGGVSGRQLADNLLAKDPSLRVVYTSGYSPGMAGKDLGWLDGHDFLPKPYEAATLVKRVRASLDGQPRKRPDLSSSPKG